MPADPKHLEFIQAITKRLASNSFQMKAWNVALATAAVGFAASKDSHPPAAVLAVVPSIAFWFLDAYYLGLERLYRDLYEAVIAGQKAAFDLNADWHMPHTSMCNDSSWLTSGSRLPSL